jgi:hypothetical protein
MITGVYTAIKKHLRQCTVETVSGTYVSGEYVEITTDDTKNLGVFPLTFKELRYLPEGAYNHQDRKFYELGSGTLNKDDIVIFQSDRFRITELTDRNFDGGFAAYLGKKEAIT